MSARRLRHAVVTSPLELELGGGVELLELKLELICAVELELVGGLELELPRELELREDDELSVLELLDRPELLD